MSKPVVRILFAVLISLVIIAAIATTVQARLVNTSQNSHAAAPLMSGQIHISQRASMYQHFQNIDPGSGGGCDHSSPDD